MRPVNLWKLQQTFLPRALGELSPRWLFVKTAENSTHLARHTSRSPFYPDPSTSSPHLFQFFSTGYLHRRSDNLLADVFLQPLPIANNAPQPRSPLREAGLTSQAPFKHAN